MLKPTPHITAAELRIMKVLWSNGPQTVRQVKDAITSESGEEPAYTTVMTMMKQLAGKKALHVDNLRQPFVYTHAVRRDQILGHRLTQFLQNVFDGRAEDLILQLAEKANLSPKDIRRIEQKIADRERRDRTDDESKGAE